MEQREYEVLAAGEGSHWWHRGMRLIATALLDRCYTTRRNLRILDAGCGTGGNALFLQRYGSVVGIDAAPEAIERNQMRDALLRGSVLSLPFADESFDLVTSFDVLYHRGVPDPTAALRETRRVLRPGGRLLIRLPAYEFLRSKHDHAVHTRQRYTASSVNTLLTAAGFSVERMSYINALLFPAVLVQRLLEQARPSQKQQQSAMALPPPLLNRLLLLPMAIEAEWLHMRGTFPFGLSVICLAHSGKIEMLQPESLL